MFMKNNANARTGNIVQAVRHMREIQAEIRTIQSLRTDELYNKAKELQVPYELVKYVHENGSLPVPNFSAEGVTTPSDAVLMIKLGAEGVFAGSGIFKSGDLAKRAAAIVKAIANHNHPLVIAELSEGY
jgi:pyridoxal 5'-phosphate synthase pdxS subunit